MANLCRSTKPARAEANYSRAENMLWTLKVNSRFLIWEGKIGYCYTSNRGQGQEEGMQLGPELWKNQISCSCCCCAWENRWECRKVRGGWKRWGKQLLVLGEDVFHQSPFLCHQHEVPLQTHRTAEAVGTCWGHYCSGGNKDLYILRPFGLWYLRQLLCLCSKTVL